MKNIFNKFLGHKKEENQSEESIPSVRQAKGILISTHEPFYLYILTQCPYCPVEYGPNELGTIDDVCNFIWTEFHIPHETEIDYGGLLYDDYESFKDEVETLTRMCPNKRQVFFVRNSREYDNFLGNYIGESLDDYDIPYEAILYMYPIECPDMSDIFKDE